MKWEQSHSFPRRGAWAFVVVLIMALFLAAPSRPATAQSLAVNDVTVDPQLVAQLADNPTGGVAATITTWEYSGLDSVEALGIEGARLHVLPMLLTNSLTQAQLDALIQSTAVRSVYANRAYPVQMEDSTWIIKARETWLPPEEGGAGITGDGVHIAVIDTGADGMHEDMDNLVEFCETTQALSSDSVTVACSPWDPASNNAPAGSGTDARLDSTDDEGHGSHVSGTIAGSGDASGGMEGTHSTIGVAPHASLHVYSANVGLALLDHQILSSYDDLIQKKQNGSEVVAVSNSWGGGDGANYNPDDPTHVAVEMAHSLGILSVFAAGNSGPEHDTLSSQCVSPYVVCVAASTKNDAVVMFSSRGRPSEPADTNRDGIVGGAGDVPPDNHDRALARALSLGIYRPTLTAPGVNINAISANIPTCREGPLNFDTLCYTALSGTSMATPHVSGVVALIVEAYRAGHGGATPTPDQIIDILERSAATNKLPGYEAEEQGAGRLNARAAVDFASTYPQGSPSVNWGTATAPYAADAHPGNESTILTETGCTSDLSWTLPEDLEGNPRYGQHTFDVPDGVERLRLTVSWPVYPTANLYLQLWRPGVDPDATGAAGPDRVYPDQEGIGLLDIGTSRWLDIRAPEAGTWALRVFHRVGDVTDVCSADSAESPKQTLGYNYNVVVEMPRAAQTPAVQITNPNTESTLGERFVDVAGTASYPERWQGITNWSVPGTSLPFEGQGLLLHFQGNTEEGCTGNGSTDVVTCSGPFLMEQAELSSEIAARWYVPDPLFHGISARNIHDPNWVWNLSEPTTLAGPMTVEFWASCGLCGQPIGGDWIIRLWADDTNVFERRMSAGTLLPNLPSKISLTVDLPSVTANTSFVLHVDPVYIDSQVNTFIHYDSSQPCPGALGSEPCDSTVRMPVYVPGGPPPIPSNLRVTDLHNALQIAWDPTTDATSYDVHRSTTPDFVVSDANLLATTAGTACNSPDVPSWPGASRSGLCYTDTAVDGGTTYYYRVVARNGDQPSLSPSQLAHGMATRFDRQVKVGVSRLWGPHVWEYATLGDDTATAWQHVWDTLELDPLVTQILARSFTQGIGSANATVQPPPPPPPADNFRINGHGKVPGEVPPDEGVGEATFGISIRNTVDGAQGLIKVRDHETGVVVRSIAIDSASVTGNTCAITGQAEVTRGNTTTVEPFSVACADNGSPGAENDVFTIDTDTYHAGGVLTGGELRVTIAD